MSEQVNHPDHYQAGDYECIDVIEALGLGFNLGNAFKYIWRAGRKGDATEDLKKAIVYLEREVNLRAHQGYAAPADIPRPRVTRCRKTPGWRVERSKDDDVRRIGPGTGPDVGTADEESTDG